VKRYKETATLRSTALVYIVKTTVQETLVK